MQPARTCINATKDPLTENLWKPAFEECLLRRDGKQPIRFLGVKILKLEFGLVQQEEIGKMNVAIYLSSKDEILLEFVFVPNDDLRLRKIYGSFLVGLNSVLSAISDYAKNIIQELSLAGLLPREQSFKPVTATALTGDGFKAAKRLLK